MKTTANALARAAPAAVLGFSAGPAGSQPRLEQTGDGCSVVHDEWATGRGDGARRRGAARLVGGGEDAAVLCTGPDPMPGDRLAGLSGGGDNAAIAHAEPSAAAAPASVPAGGGAGAAPGGASGRRG